MFLLKNIMHQENDILYKVKTAMDSLFRGLKKTSLAKQFAVASLVVFLVGMLIIGQWVSQKIQHNVIENTALSAALYLNSIVAPELHDLASGDELTADTVERLDDLYWNTPLHKRVEAVKVWGQNGLVLYSTNRTIADRYFPVTPGLSAAWEGEVHAEFTGDEHPENIQERRLGVPLLEIYTPVRVGGSNRVVAVAEFYDNATLLRDNINNARLSSWLFVSGLTTAMFLTLFGIVRRGSKTIINQQKTMQSQIAQLSIMLSQNQSLHRRVREATDRTVELNEMSLRRIGRELHDGPAQIISYGLLRLDELLPNEKGRSQQTNHSTSVNENQPESAKIGKFRESLSEALQEIRDISAGLAIPELQELSLADSILLAVNAHRRRTNSLVEVNFSNLPGELKLPGKIGVYRLVQESLNNAYYHGNGQQQRVEAHGGSGKVTIDISDSGPGFSPEFANNGERLGLSGMQERIESLGGTFAIASSPGNGTRITGVMMCS